TPFLACASAFARNCAQVSFVRFGAIASVAFATGGGAAAAPGAPAFAGDVADTSATANAGPSKRIGTISFIGKLDLITSGQLREKRARGRAPLGANVECCLA